MIDSVPIDFDVVREPWNKYEISDESVLKPKYVLTKIFKEKGGEKRGETGVGYNIKGQNIVEIIYVPKELRGKPSKKAYSPEELKASVVAEDLSYRTLSEEWNEYALEDGSKLRIKLTVTTVSRSSLINNEGDPIYHIGNNVLLNAKPPKKF
jgi:hypothetical protein